MEDATGYDSAPMIMDAPANGEALQQTRTRHSAAMQVQKPRSLATVQRRVIEEAMLSGERFFYGWGAGKDRIEGPSVKCALAVARCYGNCSVEPAPVQETAEAWIFTAYFVDHETGFTLGRQHRQSKKFIVYGKHDEARKENIRFEIGQSKALRNCILNSVPIGLIDSAIEAAKSEVGKKLDAWIAKLDKEHGTGKGLVFAVEAILKALAKNGANEARVLSKLEIADRKAIDRERLILLRSNLSALEDGEATADELFPAITTAAATDTVDGLKNAIKDAPKDEKKAESTSNGTNGGDATKIDFLGDAIKAYNDAGGIPEELCEALGKKLSDVKKLTGDARKNATDEFIKATQAIDASNDKK